jgi:hypothetical protein
MDQVADGFSLRQVNAPVQVGTEREFPRLCGPGTGGDRTANTVPQNHRRAMTSNLDDIFSRVRARRSIVRYHRLIDNGSILVENVG